jgi:hypothetical protein
MITHVPVAETDAHGGRHGWLMSLFGRAVIKLLGGQSVR